MRSQTANPGSKAQGFTLLELLVAVLLGMALLGVANGLMDQVSQGGRIVQNDSAEVEERENAIRLMREKLQDIVPVADGDMSGFKGSEHEVEFQAPPPMVMQGSGLGIYRFYLKVGSDKRHDLMVSLRMPGASHGTRTEEAKLLSGVESLSLQYDSRPVDGGSTENRKSMSGGIPLLVTVKIEFSDKGLSALEFTAQPKRTLAQQCKFDLISINCQ